MRAVCWLILALAIVVVLSTYRDYGATWDEGVQARYGELCLEYFRSAGTDKSCNSYLDLRSYGPLFEMIPALFYTPGQPGKYEIRHLFLGLFAVLSIPALWGYAKLFGDSRMMIFAVIAASTLPGFYGHWFNNSKDIPLAVCVLWFMYALAAMFSGPQVSWRGTAGCGVALGFALCARPGAFPLLSIFLLACAGFWLLSLERADAQSTWQEASWRLVPKISMVLAIGWLIMVIPWPWAHENILLNPVAAMRVAASFSTKIPVLFEGVRLQSDALPSRYLVEYILIGTPLGVLALALLGMALGAKDQIAGRQGSRSRMLALTEVWLIAPLVLFVIARPNIYGGMRHFLFILPALGVLAAYGAARILGAINFSRVRLAAGVLLLVVLLLPVLDLVALHPYQMTYFNALVGGTDGASGKYWTDYWVSSYREAIHWVNERAARSPERRFTVVIAGGPSLMLWAEEYAGPNVELVLLSTLPGASRSSLAPADYYIATTRNELDQAFPDSPIMHTIGRGGATFTVIKGRANEPSN